MTITKNEIQAFFESLETKAEEGAEDVAAELKKGVALAGAFLRSTVAALAKDPVLTAAIQAGMGGAIAGVSAAVESGGTSVLAGAALAAGKSLLISCGKTAEHELVPVVTAEIHAAVAATTAATPTHVNP
jgi:hypothetical protein